MKTPSSAFVCAFFAAAMIPRSGHAAVAAVNSTPVAAQKAFQTALTGLDASGWPAAAEAASVAQPTPTLSPKAPPAKTDPIMTEELMARLIKVVSTFNPKASLDKDICKVLDLCDGTVDLAARQAKADNSTDGWKHTILLPATPGSKDVIFARMTPGSLEVYLTDKTGKLRAAVVQKDDGRGPRLITNEKAAEQYQKELALFAEEAAGLPPTGAVVAGR